MSKHVSQKRSFIISRFEYYEKPKESGEGVLYGSHFVSDIYCSCGYQGSGKFELSDKKRTNETSSTPANFYSNKDCMETSSTCPVCGNSTFNYFNNPKAVSFVDFTKIWINEEKVSFHICYTDYFYNKKVSKVAATKRRIALTFNSRTGNMYLINGKQLVNWTYCSTSGNLFEALSKFKNLLLDDQACDNFYQFCKTCLAKRSITFFNIDTFFESNYFSVSDLRSIFLVLKYPVLQDAQFNTALTDCALPKKVRKNLLSAKNIDESIRTIFNFKNKKITRLFKENDYHPIFPIFSFILEGQGSTDYFCDLFDKSAYTSKNSYRNHMGMFHSTNDSSTTLITYENTICHYITNEFDYRKSKDVELIVGGLLFFKQFFKTESAFLRKLFNSRRKMVDSDEKITLTIFEMLNYIKDAYRMVLQIQDQAPELSVDFTNDFIYYHDILSKTVARIKKENEFITYSDEEKDFYNDQIGKYDIHLARSTDEIIKSGTDMSICVPSYAERTVYKELYILFVYDGEVPVCCIELSITSNSVVVVQVKGPHNNIVSDDLGLLLCDYFNHRSISYSSCYDMDSFETIVPSLHSNRFKNIHLIPSVTPRANGNIEVSIKPELEVPSAIQVGV